MCKQHQAKERKKKQKRTTQNRLDHILSYVLRGITRRN